MTDTHATGMEIHVRCRVERNSKSFSRERTVSVTGRMEIVATSTGTVFRVIDAAGRRIGLDTLLDDLHREADASNQREIERQQREQLSAIAHDGRPAGH